MSAIHTIGAWLSLVERCVRDAEVACSNHVAPSKKINPRFSEGLFFSMLHVIWRVTSGGVNSCVRAQRVHEVRGTSALDRPQRSADRVFESRRAEAQKNGVSGIENSGCSPTKLMIMHTSECFSGLI